MPSKQLSRWSRFKNWVTGMTEEERDVDHVDEQIWQLEKALQWNAEIGKKHFNEVGMRAEIANLKKQATALRRRLPTESRYKAGPNLSSYYHDPIYELEAHVGYLQHVLMENRINPNFPLLQVQIRLRMLEEQLAMMDRGDYYNSLPHRWQMERHYDRRGRAPPQSMSTSPGFSPPSPWGQGPVPVAPAQPMCPGSSPWGPPDNAPQPIRGPFGGRSASPPRGRSRSPQMVTSCRGIGASSPRARDPSTGRFVRQTQSPQGAGRRGRQ